MLITCHRGAGVGGSGVGSGRGSMDNTACSLWEMDFPISCDILKHLKTKPKMNIWKCVSMEITRECIEFLNIVKNWPNLAPVLKIWRKKYLSGESGG